MNTDIFTNIIYVYMYEYTIYKLKYDDEVRRNRDCSIVSC